MSAAPVSPSLRLPASPAWLILLSLLLLLPLAPPETRGESLAGCAFLIALLGVFALRARDASSRYLPLILLAAAAIPLGLAAKAWGAAVQPLCVAFLAGAAGLYTARLGADLRERSMLAPLLLAVAGTGVAVHGLYQELWGLERVAANLGADATPWQALALERLREGRVFAFFATPAALGGFLAMSLPATVGASLQRRATLRWLLLLAAALQLGGLLAAASLSAAAGLLGAFALAAFGWKRARRKLALGLLALGLLLACVMAVRGLAVLDPAAPQGPLHLRAANARLAWRMIVDHPWLGVGPGGFGEAYPRYRQPGDNETQHAHNLPLELAAELGLPAGLLVSALFFYVFLGPCLGCPRASSAGQRATAVGLAAFALQNLADFTAFFPSLLWTAAIMRGWHAWPEHEAPVAAMSLQPADAPARALKPALTLAAAVVAASLLALAGLAWEQRQQAREALAAGDIEAAESCARQASRLAPWDVDAWVLYAQTSGARARESSDRAALREVLARIDRAVRLSPVRPLARLLRSRIRLALGDLPGAYADALAAARLYPMQEQYARERDRLGRLLQQRVAGPA